MINLKERLRGGAHDADSAGLRRLAQFSIDHKALVIGLWAAAALLLTLLLPQLETVAKKQATDPIPANVPSFQALDRMEKAFNEPGSSATVFVAMHNPDGFGAARPRYEQFVERLRNQPHDVRSVRDLASDRIASHQAVSEDGTAWYLPVGLSGRLGGPDTTTAVENVRQTARQVFADSGTEVHVTGPAATFVDQIKTAESELLVISIATLILIGVILMIVYRSIVTAILPLVVIGASLAVARGILSGLGLLGMPISEYSIAFLTAILLGAGTDYSVFVIARYHERIRAGDSPAEAIVSATASIGRVVIASAMTVALALLAMVFAKLSVFTTVGPACAIAILVALAASLTLLQPILLIAAQRGRGLPGREVTARYWRRVGATVVRRPRRLLVASLVLLIALSVPLLGIQLSFDDRGGQPKDTDSNLGYALMDAHFPKDIVVSQFLLVTSPKDLRTATGLADLDQMAARVAQLPGVTRVVGVTRPTGEKLEQAQLSWQNGEIGRRLGDSVAQGNERKPDLEALRSGAHQLSDALALLRDRIDTDLAPLAQTLDGATSTAQQLNSYRPWLTKLKTMGPRIDSLAKQAPDAAAAARDAQRALVGLDPILQALNAPACSSTVQCAQIRSQLRQLTALGREGFFDDVAGLARDLRSGDTSIAAMSANLDQAMSTMDSTLATLTQMNVSQKFDQLRSGVAQLADGSAQLAGGVDALVGNTMDTLVGMGQIAGVLRASAEATTGSDSATGFYLPPDAFDNRDFAAVARQFVSHDGQAVRYIVETRIDPYSHEAVALSNAIQDTSRAALPNTELADAQTAVAGFPAINADVQRLLNGDFKLLAVATILIVGLILMMLLRSVVAPIYLVLTVMLNYTAALGLGVLVFQHLLHKPLFWPVPLLAFIILVAVGADYNMLLVSRLREESAAGLRTGVMRTVGYTGPVITSAGVIFAASMFGLMAGSVILMVQAGFVIGAGLLIDTFIVRTLTVPAIAALLGKANWWPGRAVNTGH
ncbi:RND family transporter [Gordonia sp. (in: high G+C Gram-positive bacteria)]|uniref:MMPL/RND family transporter n=1 Tax=Gordonia sp. (in: high G+C Gram-positive bacteria) TaxID=84139 RepID=UPI0039E2DD6A